MIFLKERYNGKGLFLEITWTNNLKKNQKSMKPSSGKHMSYKNINEHKNQDYLY